MTVRELIDILQRCDPDMPIATHANNHTYMSGIEARTHGPVRVALMDTYGGDHVVIGNISKRQINPPNWFVTAEVDGGSKLPENWL